jgi:hypothetical protein
MWQTLRNIISGVKTVKKYGSLFVVVLDILGYSSEKLETWTNENQPKDKEKKV